MKATDLRIGNLIYDENREIVVDVAINILTAISHKIEHYKPIQLTEDWLLKFGFLHAKLFDCDLFTSSWNFHISVLNGEYQFNYKESAKSQWIPLIKIQYIHQLQNLYFALTNEELIFK